MQVRTLSRYGAGPHRVTCAATASLGRGIERESPGWDMHLRSYCGRTAVALPSILSGWGRTAPGTPSEARPTLAYSKAATVARITNVATSAVPSNTVASPSPVICQTITAVPISAPM